MSDLPERDDSSYVLQSWDTAAKQGPLNCRRARFGSGIVLALSALAGGDKIAFPEDYAKGVMYGTVDRHDNMQYREYGRRRPPSKPCEKASRSRAGQC